MKMKRLLWGFITIAAVTLVGCGGGGGGGNNSRIMELEDMLSSVTSERDMAQARVTELEGMLSDANDMIDDLNMQIANAPTQAMVDELTQMRDNYMTMANDYKTMLDAANAELAQLREDAAEDMAAAARADRMAREMRVRTSIGENRVLGTTTANTDETRFPGAAASTTAGITRRTAAEPAAEADRLALNESQFHVTRAVDGTITIDLNGSDNDDAYMGGDISAGSGDWNGAVLTRTNDDTNKTKDTLVIYTDIDAPADVLFTTRYTAAQRAAITAITNFGKLAASAEFPSGPSNTKSYGGDTGNPASFNGSVGGVDGVFACTGTCSLQTNDSGEVGLGTDSGAWSFTPNAPNSATVKVPDLNYAWFGWWLNKPEDNADPHMVQVFAGGTNPAIPPVTLEGNARYTGEAAGKYTTRTFTAGVQTDAGVGHFTADASLTAKFGDGTAGDDGTISGNITGFVLDDTNSVSWRVALEQTTFTDSASTFAGWTEADFGGGLSKTDNAADPAGIGRWQGSFYGLPTTGPAGQRHPDAVAGTFDAVTADGNATVIGGFGATKQ